jgi:hypothetical protein
MTETAGGGASTVWPLPNRAALGLVDAAGVNEPPNPPRAGKGRGAALRRALLAAVVASSALALSSCGLENLPYLLPPGYSDPATIGTPVYTVNNPSRDVNEVLVFRGFELYYKFFNSETQTVDQNAQSGLSTREQIVSSYGFHRMCTEGTQTQVLPFIPVDPADRGSVFDVQLDFSSVDTNSEAIMIYLGTVPPAPDPPYGSIRREATESGGEPQTFAQDKLQAADDDMNGVTWPSAGQALNLVVYAISYGVQDYSPVYSTARYLGYMSYYF